MGLRLKLVPLVPSLLYTIAAGSSIHNQLGLYSDHHSGSEEHQLGEEYFDPEIYDEKLGRVNTVPLMQANLQQFEESKWVVPFLQMQILLRLHGEQN